MKSVLALTLILLGSTTTALAQNAAPDRAAASSSISLASTAAPPALDANEVSGAQAQEVAPMRAQDPPLIALAAPPRSLAALSFAIPPPSASFGHSRNSSPPSLATFAEASPAAPTPPYGYNEREYNLEITLGVSIVRFRSSVYEATGVGLHSAAAFFVKDWLAIEGAVSTGFAPTIYSNEHIKIVTYGAGPKISLGHSRIEPWVHVLGGGIHALPQTALGGQNGFQVTSGLGADYGLNPRLSIRLEGDYVRSRLFSQWQNSFQAIAAAVVHF